MVRDMTVSTFHSLGLAIVGEAEGRRPVLAKVAEDDRALTDLLKRIVADLRTDRTISATLLSWFQEQFAPYRSQAEFQTWGAYWDYIRRYGIRSLKGEQVKSFEECEIANFLYLHGVNYEYERAYEHNTGTPGKGPYRPDFYLPDAAIYIEHFGIDANGKTAPFVPQQEYLRSMAWKRQLHAERGTTLIETFSHEHAAGTLTRNLAAKLQAHGVSLSPIPPAKVFAILEEQGRIDPFIRLLATFLHHYKGAQLTFSGGSGSRRKRAGPSAGRSLSHRVSTDFRAVPGNAVPVGTDRLPRHDQPGGGPCRGRPLPQSVRLHPRR